MELSAYILPDIFNLWDCRNRIIERMDFVFDFLLASACNLTLDRIKDPDESDFVAFLAPILRPAKHQ